ncbi:SusC/RagA family TonB-linked outer membrane protein [Sphingobacterium paludis]|uniref:TonB-linked SusC/RagA family outer membrane protein n=1 Tax=Sphingobacterium paludis TaxID=1476465 RepID=A0A4R7CS33_9SPHI|nr:SusC/RagA family TonB-linked outer membrane protein [Sphingobacterium paludis]TDS06814.1 TonB-linked SusC/RagA family outer membrane protein [Sphingobacterium paludis]
MRALVILLSLFWAADSFGQRSILVSISAIDGHSGKEIPDASLIKVHGGVSARIAFGEPVEMMLGDSIRITHLNYKTGRWIVDSSFESGKKELRLEPRSNMLEAVAVSTGYQNLEKRRMTGSAVTVDRASLERNVGTNVIDRLEGLASGLTFNRATSSSAESQHRPELRVRGINTIHSSSSPLIILDDFPYEGDLSSIDPSSIESVSVLKDASAAAIWGAKAGNGVIVINTRRGVAGTPVQLEFSSNLSLRNRPDLLYSRNYLQSSAIMELEEQRFASGAYVERDWTPLPAFVELLIDRRDGRISEETFGEAKDQMLRTDLRREASEHLYRTGLLQQYALNMSGGSHNVAYNLNIAHDSERYHVVGNDRRRLKLSSSSTFQLSSRLKLHTGINLASVGEHDNGRTMSGLSLGTLTVSPYTRLAGDQGNSLPMVSLYRLAYTRRAVENGLFDWDYRPLEETRLANNQNSAFNLRGNAELSYKIARGLSVKAQYGYQRDRNDRESLFSRESFYVRDMVNRFTQADGSRIVPHGAIFETSGATYTGRYGRAQIDYNGNFAVDHSLSALAGAERREETTLYRPAQRLFDYDPLTRSGRMDMDYLSTFPTRPRLSAKIPATDGNYRRVVDRFISYYATVNYSYRDRYTFSGSLRWDASNLFGIKTNDKGVPLWSAGASWEISKEDFFTSKRVDYLRLRASYGANGNVNNLVSVYPVVIFSQDYETGLRSGALRSTGNPGLRWETIRNLSLGADFRLKGNYLQGSIEWYRKAASDLIGYDIIDPTTGVFETSGRFEIDNRINYGNMLTSGVDIELRSQFSTGSVKWNIGYLLNYTANRITRYNVLKSSTIQNYFTIGMAPPKEGRTADAIYGLPWHGLDPLTGDPQVMIDGQMSKQYAQYLNALSVEDLIFQGSSVPLLTSSLFPSVSWRGIDLTFNILYSGKFYFRRSGINYNTLLSGGTGHVDYYDRWMQPGDQEHTDVPSMPASTNLSRDRVYVNSETLLERGDHIRLKDITLAYELARIWNAKGIRGARFFVNMNNVGILWRANSYGIDPQVPNATYPAPRIMSIGLKLKL